jgi:site-specific recombinase XerD
MQQRLTVVRLFYDYLVGKGLCSTNPVGRRTYVAGTGFGRVRDRSLLTHFYKLPWILSDDQWQRLFQVLREETLGTVRSFKQVAAATVYAWTGEQQRSLTARQVARLLVSREETLQEWRDAKYDAS